MFRVAIGQCEGTDSDAVLDAVIEQCEVQLHGDTPRAGVVLCSGDYGYSRILATLVARYPGIEDWVKNAGEIEMYFVLAPL